MKLEVRVRNPLIASNKSSTLAYSTTRLAYMTFSNPVVKAMALGAGDATVTLDHSDYATEPILAKNIRRMIQFPDPDFLALTDCDEWKPPLH